jgi:hypothetical protein
MLLVSAVFSTDTSAVVGGGHDPNPPGKNSVLVMDPDVPKGEKDALTVKATLPEKPAGSVVMPLSEPLAGSTSPDLMPVTVPGLPLMLRLTPVSVMVFELLVAAGFDTVQ